MTTHVRVSGTWRQISNIYVRVSGTWRQLSEMYVRVSGTWRRVFVLVVPGSINYTGTGTNTFTVPPYNSLTARVWGAGAGSFGVRWDGFGNNNATSGQSSYFSGSGASLTANGGSKAQNDTDGNNPAGGTASGGSTNTTGTTGGGYALANGGLNAQCGTWSWPSGTTRGRGGGSPNGGSTIPGRTSAGAGINGNSPGGGAAGSAYCRAGSITVNGAKFVKPGGAGGGYCTRTWTSGQLTLGGSISLRVGTRGTRGTGDTYNGGYGAHGRVEVQWS